MIKLHKKVVSGVLVGLAVFGGVFQYKGIAAQAEVKVLQEERNLSSKQKRDLYLKEEIEGYIKVFGKGKYEVVKRFYSGGYYSKEVNSLKDFISIQSSLRKGNCMLHIGSVELLIIVK